MSRRLFEWNLFISTSADDDNNNNQGEDGGAASSSSIGQAVSLGTPSKSQSHGSRPRPRRNGPASQVGSCVFGPASTKSQLHLQQQTWWNNCPHITFGDLVASWAKTLPLWRHPPMDVKQDDPSPMLHRTSLNAFTMVRDPFDRLVSYFYYLRKFSYTNNFLMGTVTRAQYRCVEDNDLEGWFRQLHLENGGRGLNLPYQYKYVHEDVHEAIQLIQNDANPQVFTLLTECYEVSLRLLAENFRGFRLEDIDKFMDSEHYQTNNNKALYNEKPDRSTLNVIRKKAEIWFAADFQFYHAAVEQFVEKMKTSGLSEEALQTCVHWNHGVNEEAKV